MVQSIEVATYDTARDAAWEVMTEVIQRTQTTDPGNTSPMETAALAMIAVGVRAAMRAPEWAQAFVGELDRRGRPLNTDDCMALRVVASLPVGCDTEVA